MISEIENVLLRYDQGVQRQIQMVCSTFQDGITQFNDSLAEFRGFSSKSANKGNIAECLVKNKVAEYFPMCEIHDMHKETATGDFVMLLEQLRIMFEIKSYKNNLPTAEIDKFYRDLFEEKNAYDIGILINLSSGIVGHDRFSYDVIAKNGKQKVIVYLPNADTHGYAVIWAILFAKSYHKLQQISQVDPSELQFYQTVCQWATTNYEKFRTSLQKCEDLRDRTKRARKTYEEVWNEHESLLNDQKNLAEDMLKHFDMLVSGDKSRFLAITRANGESAKVVEAKKFICSYCQQTYANQGGLKVHQGKCKMKPEVN